MNYRVLWPEKLVETMDDLGRRIAERFPESGLNQLAGELRQIVNEAVRTVERIRRPNLFLRAGVAVLIAGLAALVVRIALELRWSPDHFREGPSLVQFTDSSLTSIVFLSAGIAFLVTLERRRKRTRALKAFHELRAMAHIIDLHQLRKDPERFFELKPEEAPASRVLLPPEEMAHYLDHCSELLSVISKIAALYVQDFPDSAALDAADQIETLTTGLSRKIWQKISLMERLVRRQADEFSPDAIEAGQASLQAERVEARRASEQGLSVDP
jgi:hypothetical protein